MNPSKINFDTLPFIAAVVCFALLIGLASLPGCKKDHYTDTSFVSSGASAASPAAMFIITQDNTGLVTITPSGTAASSYDILLGDTTKDPVTVPAGGSIRHTYPEGIYQVKITGHDLKGGTATATQTLTVSYITPQNLKVTLSTSSLTVSVSATAKYATFFNIYYGDNNSANPVPYTQTLAGNTVTHTYANAGTYVVKVVALSGGTETAQYLDTIQVANPISLPVTFEDPNTDYTVSDFGGNVSVLTTDPTNSSNHVIKTIKTAGAQTWAGTTIGGANGFPTPVPLTASRLKMTVSVYSPAAGIPVLLKLEDHTNGNTYMQVQVNTTLASQWETLTFDFSQATAPAWNASNNYDKASLFFDFNNPGSGKVFYWDNVIFP